MTDPTPATASLSLPAPSSAAALREWAWSKGEVREQLIRSRIPPRYMVNISEWPEPKQLAVLEKCESMLTHCGAIIALCSQRGTGKTTIGCQLIIRRAWKCWGLNQSFGKVFMYDWTPYRKLSDLIARYKPLYADFGSIGMDELEAARNALCKADLLVIDEVADYGESKIAQRMIQDIADRMYANRRDLVLISNETPEQFRISAGESVYSRLCEHGAIIPCRWDSFRDKGY